MALNLTRRATALGLVATLAGCGLPRSGPNKNEIFAGAVQKGGDAFVVTVTQSVTRATALAPSFGFSQAFLGAGVMAQDIISPGDTVSVTVFENVKDDPLLGNTGQRVSSLETLQVDGQGFIFVPYAGRIKAAGQTAEGLRDALTRKLDPQTPDPQIVVQRASGLGSTVTVNGMVGAQGNYAIEAPTRTLTAMIAAAGGVSIPQPVAVVHVTRGNRTEKVWLTDLYENPRLDIALRPGDIITVEQDSRAFVALGATGAQNRVAFQTQTLSALEAIATVGGLNASSADPTGVFILRNEPAEIANAVLGRSDLQGDQRFVYVLDLTQPTGMFEARDFLVRDGDTVYVTEAPFVQWSKTLSAITGTSGAADSLATTATGG